MNYVGYSTFRSPRERLEELNRGISYLERAARLEGAPESLPLTVSWMYDQRRRVRSKLNETDTNSNTSGGLDESQIEFLTEIFYLVESRDVRRAISGLLEDTDRGIEMLNRRAREYDRRFHRRRATRFTYLPPDTWPLIGPEVQ